MCDFTLGTSFTHFAISKKGSSICSQNIYSYLQQNFSIYSENHSLRHSQVNLHMDTDFEELVDILSADVHILVLTVSIFKAFSYSKGRILEQTPCRSASFLTCERRTLHLYVPKLHSVALGSNEKKKLP